ncbi:hypothetical protein C8R43DRAFT_1124265 [Mycena crocata]|nr:hypothetical protein C8R43DRAFT_1124265 [Mycena crocata]
MENTADSPTRSGATAPSSRSPRSSRSSSPEPDAPKTKRQIVNFALDDGNPEWEDMDGDQLGGIGTTTHRSRNRGKPVIPMRKHRRRDPGTNSRATARKRKEAKGDKTGTLAQDIKQWELEREERVHELAAKHDIKAKEVRRRMLASTTLKPSRKPSLYNAKISRIMADLNEGHELGTRYTIPEVKRMVADDPTMLDAFTEEEEEEMLRGLEEKRDVKHNGARATNKVAKEDARQTIDRLAKEIMALAERTGMICFVFFTRGHIHDHSIPASIESWGSMRFVREILGREPTDVQSMFELWAVNQLRGDTGSMTLQELQKECTRIITSGYLRIMNAAKGVMNYDNYIKSIVMKKGYRIVNWTKETPFKRMSLQSSIGPLRALHKVLKDGTHGGVAEMLVEQRRKRLQRLARKTAARHDDEGDNIEERALPKRKAVHDDDDGNDEPPAKKKARRRDAEAAKERAPRKSGKRKAVEESEDVLYPCTLTFRPYRKLRPSERPVFRKLSDESPPQKKTKHSEVGNTLAKTAKAKAARKADVEPRKPSKPGERPRHPNPGVQPPRNTMQGRPKPKPSWKGATGTAGSSKAASSGGAPTSPPNSPRASPPHSPVQPASPSLMPPPSPPHSPAQPASSSLAPPSSRPDSPAQPASPPRTTTPTTPAPTDAVVPDSEPGGSRGGSLALAGAAMRPPSGLPDRWQVGDGEVVPDSETSGSRATTVVPPRKSIKGPRGAPPGLRDKAPA